MDWDRKIFSQKGTHRIEARKSFHSDSVMHFIADGKISLAMIDRGAFRRDVARAIAEGWLRAEAPRETAKGVGARERWNRLSSVTTAVRCPRESW